ncbi:unnamed protein product [Rotaria sp. Silwood1]|nr:unnamed protein product [Rotaria sp. Silwood1]CAF1675897.1 unnamed protein product [Rotaria sp. Silwood1]
MSNKDDESIEMIYSKSCLDLNMDMETKLDAWRSYEHIRKHYVLEGDQLHCVEHVFNISSIIFEKYRKIFIEIFGGNQYKRTSNQINPKLNTKNKLNKCSHQDLYSLLWTIYALAKTIYPLTINDLIASFHLLISSFFFYL